MSNVQRQALKFMAEAEAKEAGPPSRSSSMRSGGVSPTTKTDSPKASASCGLRASSSNLLGREGSGAAGARSSSSQAGSVLDYFGFGSFTRGRGNSAPAEVTSPSKSAASPRNERHAKELSAIDEAFAAMNEAAAAVGGTPAGAPAAALATPPPTPGLGELNLVAKNPMTPGLGELNLVAQKGVPVPRPPATGAPAPAGELNLIDASASGAATPPRLAPPATYVFRFPSAAAEASPLHAAAPANAPAADRGVDSEAHRGTMRTGLPARRTSRTWGTTTEGSQSELQQSEPRSPPRTDSWSKHMSIDWKAARGDLTKARSVKDIVAGLDTMLETPPRLTPSRSTK